MAKRNRKQQADASFDVFNEEDRRHEIQKDAAKRMLSKVRVWRVLIVLFVVVGVDGAVRRKGFPLLGPSGLLREGGLPFLLSSRWRGRGLFFFLLVFMRGRRFGTVG